MDDHIPYRVVSVRGGDLRPIGSWVYVWIDLDSKKIAYVGGTGFDPELRAYLHLTDEDPNIGRVRAQVSHAAQGNFDVLGFAVPDAVARPRAKAALIGALARLGLFSGESAPEAELSPLIHPMVTAIRDHLVNLGHAEH
ncbi:MAG TPA: hypothetical protein VIJ18_06000 [Microbacteriaceae bacterium]